MIECSSCSKTELKIDHNMKKAFFNNVWVCSYDCHIEYEKQCRSYPDKGILSKQQLNEIIKYWK